MNENNLIGFEHFYLDLDKRELRHHKRFVKLTGRPFKVLCHLIEKQPAWVTVEDLIDEFWGDIDRDKGPDSVHHCISAIREALGESGTDQKLIQTNPRNNSWETKYKFAGAITNADNCDCGQDNVSLSIAVLPFATSIHNDKAKGMGLAIQEHLIHQLEKIGNHLHVPSFHQTTKFKGFRQGAGSIGRKLGVPFVIEGRIWKSGHRLSVCVSLIDVAKDTLKDARIFTELTDPIDAVSLIVKWIVLTFNINLTRDETKQLTQRTFHDLEAILANAEGQEMYMRGRYALEGRTETDLKMALEFFQLAIDKEPDFAEAYVMKANTLAMLGYGKVGARAPKTVLPQAKEAALKALELDPHLGEAKAVLAWTAFIYDWKWHEAEDLFNEALTLKPFYATAHHWFAHYLVAMKCRREAYETIERAEKLAVTSPIISSGVGLIHFFCRDYDKAIHQFEKTLKGDPNFLRARFELGRAYTQLHDYAKAISEFQAVCTNTPDNPRILSALGHAYALSGERGKALEMLQQLQQLANEREYISPGAFAKIYIGLGEVDKAISWLDKALEVRSSWLPYANVEPVFDPLRSDNRFQEIVRKVGLP